MAYGYGAGGLRRAGQTQLPRGFFGPVRQLLRGLFIFLQSHDGLIREKAAVGGQDQLGDVLTAQEERAGSIHSCDG